MLCGDCIVSRWCLSLAQIVMMLSLLRAPACIKAYDHGGTTACQAGAGSTTVVLPFSKQTMTCKHASVALFPCTFVSLQSYHCCSMLMLNDQQLKRWLYCGAHVGAVLLMLIGLKVVAEPPKVAQVFDGDICLI